MSNETEHQRLEVVSLFKKISFSSTNILFFYNIFSVQESVIKITLYDHFVDYQKTALVHFVL